MSQIQDNPIVVTVDSDTDIKCMSCGYNLRATSGKSCPECGVFFTLDGPRRRQRYGLYLAAFYCAAAMVSGIVGIAYTVSFAAKGYMGLFDDPARVISHVISLLAVPYLVVLIILRKQITEGSLSLRLCFAVPPLVLIAVMTVYTIYDAITI